MTTLHIGDSVKYTGSNPTLNPDKTYRIRSIIRGIDGAYDYDDIMLDDVFGRFCEFDFEVVKP